MHFLRNEKRSKKTSNKNILTKLQVVACLVLFLTTGVAPVYAVSDEEQLQNLNNQIQSAQQQLRSVQGQKTSLQNELMAFDIKINSIQLQVNAAQAQINILNNQIAETNNQISKAESDLAKQKQIMSEYLKTMYIEGQVSTIELIAKSENFSDFVNQSEYLGTIQDNVQGTANKIVELQNKLIAEKKQQEVKKAKAEQLKSQQVAKRNEIETQRSGRQYLLNQTQGSENSYKSYIANLQAKFTTLQNAIWSQANNSGSFVSLGHVSRGDIIGYVGNTGYSTGCHLHFEIRTSPNAHVNPVSYIGDGYFVSPVSGSPTIPYGYSSYYFTGVFHTGVDYGSVGCNAPIKATADGEIITRVSGQTNTYPAGPVIYGNYVMIKHTNGMYSLYGHMR